MSYYSSEGKDWPLSITKVSLNQWPSAEDAVRHPKQAKPDRSFAQVAGFDADLLTYFSITRPISGYDLSSKLKSRR